MLIKCISELYIIYCYFVQNKIKNLIILNGLYYRQKFLESLEINSNF